MGDAGLAGDKNSADDALATADAWHRRGLGVAIATVVATWGSSPRPAGSQLAVDDGGRFVGSVSGGCVEAAVIEEARVVIASGVAKLLEFGVANSHAWEVGLACGGRIQVLVERFGRRPAILARLLAGRAAGRCMVLLTDLQDGTQALLGEDDGAVTGDLAPSPATMAAAQAAMQRDSSGIVESDGRRLFLHVFTPRPRLIVVGAVHIAKSLLRLAELADYRAILVDPRQTFAAQDGFAAATVIDAWPDEALAALGLDRRAAVVTLTHDPKLDDAALQAALASPAFYIGALGSRKTHAARLARLAALGFGEADLARIHGPVGLAIGAATPAEIAIAILAEITQVRRQTLAEQRG